METRGFIQHVEIVEQRVKSFEEYPFCIPAIRSLRKRLTLHPQATILVGENGSGKSTLVEGIAVAAGFNPEGGSTQFSFSTRSSESELSRCLRLARTERRPRTGYFLRAESFFNVATNIEELDREPALAPPIIDAYGGRSLHEQSHGESFWALVQHRFGPSGLYILDEPEAALSPRRQVLLLQRIAELLRQGSQFLIATHSPILSALPGALIYSLSTNGIAQVNYEETDCFLVTRAFLAERAAAFHEAAFDFAKECDAILRNLQSAPYDATLKAIDDLEGRALAATGSSQAGDVRISCADLRLDAAFTTKQPVAECESRYDQLVESGVDPTSQLLKACILVRAGAGVGDSAFARLLTATKRAQGAAPHELIKRAEGLLRSHGWDPGR